jgi:hypothetical protein
VSKGKLKHEHGLLSSALPAVITCLVNLRLNSPSFLCKETSPDRRGLVSSLLTVA